MVPTVKMLEKPALPSAIENIVINKLDQSRHILFLYTSNEVSTDVFISLLQFGVDNGGSSLYLSTGFTNGKIKEKFKAAIQPNSKCHVLFGYDDINHIKREISNIFRKSPGENLHVVIDYEATSSLEDSDIIKIERMLSKIKNKQESISIISAFNTSSLTNKILSKLLKFHEQILVSSENSITTLMGGGDLIRGDEPTVNILPKEILDKLVKDNLRVSILSLLSRGDLSGYDIIKEIDKKFRVKLSPGTIYPLLYSLQGEGLIEVKTNTVSAKRKNYGPTKNGKKLIENEILDSLTARKYLSDFIIGGGGR